MKNISALLLLSLVTVACSKSGGGGGSSDGLTEAITPTTTSGSSSGGTTGSTTGGSTTGGTTGSSTGGGTTGGTTGSTTGSSTQVPNGALTFDTNIVFVNFSANSKEKVYKAADLIKQVVATKAFRDAVLAHKYNGKKQFNNNLGLTNTQIYNKILNASEKLTPGNNNTLDVELELYTDDTTVVGYTFGSSKRIWMNTKYFNKFYPYQVSANLFHEWLHKIGFGHDYEATEGRPYSVPYAVGTIMRNMAKKFYNNN